MKFARFFRPAHIPSVLIMLVLFYSSSQPASGLPAMPPPLDKVIHFVAYAVLGGSLCLWIRGERWIRHPWTHALIVCVACAAFGLTDEFHQSFVPGRSVSAGDLLADVAGGAFAVFLYIRFRIHLFADRYTFFQKK